MEKSQLLRADYLDILFDGRNKSYGGYELRRRYAGRARKAGLSVIAGVAIAVAIPVIASSFAPVERVAKPYTDPTILRKIEVEEHIVQPPVHVAPPPPPVATIRNPVFKVVQDEPTDDPPAVEDLHHAVSGLTTSLGADTTSGLVPAGPTGGGAVLVDAAKHVDRIPTIVDQMPEFNGSLEAYLERNLHYPEDARSAGIDGRVGVQFVVNEDGSISQAEVFHKAAPVLDAEALRVVRSMPKWRPGKQSGKPVKVYFTLPITFALGY